MIALTFKPDGTVTTKKPPREREYIARIAHEEQSSLVYSLVLRIYDLLKGNVISQNPAKLSEWQIKQIREMKNTTVFQVENDLKIVVANKIAGTKATINLTQVYKIIREYVNAYHEEWGYPYEQM